MVKWLGLKEKINSALQTTDALINGGYSGGPVVFEDFVNCGMCARDEYSQETIECQFVRMFEIRAKVEAWKRNFTIIWFNLLQRI